MYRDLRAVYIPFKSIVSYSISAAGNVLMTSSVADTTRHHEGENVTRLANLIPYRRIAAVNHRPAHRSISREAVTVV